jgi:hypothetical protein
VFSRIWGKRNTVDFEKQMTRIKIIKNGHRSHNRERNQADRGQGDEGARHYRSKYVKAAGRKLTALEFSN